MGYQARRLTLCRRIAEFRGPGIHHGFDEAENGYEQDNKNRAQRIGLGNYPGRIIFLGDGSESQISVENEDAEMFDSVEEEKDLQSQVPKGDSPEGATATTAGLRAVDKTEGEEGGESIAAEASKE